MPGRNHIILIIKKHLREELLSTKEADILERWLKKSAANQRTWEKCTNSEEILGNLQQANSIDLNESWKKIEGQLNRPDNPYVLRRDLFKRTLWAAAFIGFILIVIGIRETLQKAKKSTLDLTIIPGKDIFQGQGKSVLSLQDGTQILPDTLSLTTRLKRNGLRLLKDTAGYLHFLPVEDKETIFYTRLTNTYSKQTKLILSDGSQIWLNPASSIRFPASFPSEDRTVELTGEAFFDVAREPKRPFKVIFSNGTSAENGPQVSVLGTRFSLSTISKDHLIHAVLIQGAVQFSRGNGKGVILHPGQEGLFDTLSNKVIVRAADTVIANSLTKHYFVFDWTPIDDALDVIARWYGVTIETSPILHKITVSAELDKDKGNLETLLKIFSDAGGIQIKRLNDKIIVSPK